MIDTSEIDERIHVYPTFGREHIISNTEPCWCEPEPLPDEPCIIVHNAEH
jgi:hypothetical protein